MDSGEGLEMCLASYSTPVLYPVFPPQPVSTMGGGVMVSPSILGWTSSLGLLSIDEG